MAAIWTWLSRHRLAVKLGSLALAVILLGSGLFLGMSQAAGSPAPLSSPPGATHPLAKPTKHYLVGTVVDRLGAGTVIVRSKAGRFFVVHYDAKTRVRRNGADVKPALVRRGTRVVILGDPVESGFAAEVVTITGTVPAVKTPAPTAPVATSTQHAIRRSADPTPTPHRSLTPGATY